MRKDKMGFVVNVKFASDLWRVFGRRLELGGWSTSPTGGRVYIAPRPHIRPVVEKMSKDFGNKVDRELE